jgi:Ni/Co efflux regulator RcnB
MRRGLWILAGIALFGSSLAMAQDQAGQRNSDRSKTGRSDTGRPDVGRPGASRPDAGAPNQPSHGSRPPAHRPPAQRPPAEPRPHVGPRPAHRFLSGGGWHRSMRGPAFRYPPGFAYRTWTTGAILPPIFLAAPYFYDDYTTLGLAPPPAGYRWVRYGSDLLLVNIISGRVADVVDGVFY